MNTDAQKEQTPLAEIGLRLSEARNALNLSQQVVAEQLRLKVTTVRELEAGLNPLDLAPTFIRGYIRSYARLVHIPEDELIALLPKAQVEKNIVESNRIKGFTLSKGRKKLDRWLTLFTWLIIFVVLGLTGAWWWESHKAQQSDITASSNGLVNQILIPTTQPETTPAPVPTPTANSASQTQTSTTAAPDATAATPSTVNSNQTANQSVTPTLEQAVAAQVAESQAATGVMAPQVQDGNDIYMTFTADCWVEVIDSRGKNLYSGLQRKGGKLSLTGQAPYRVKLGAPAGIDIIYKGKQVDLSQYRNSNRTARLTLAAE
ncbi:Cytoskeleton protein rodZ [Pragia fontium]|uniref:cytoskeleton protein RodZ n=1 Tax=Pragia fontium TaxID=82985 RepID=UPI000E0694E5|nr:cytoskeleton protein RodZ [Pragia fontium]SUB83399.1 Cytoskeleton protein rodZ [Pragia fontium]